MKNLLTGKTYKIALGKHLCISNARKIFFFGFDTKLNIVVTLLFVSDTCIFKSHSYIMKKWANCNLISIIGRKVNVIGRCSARGVN